jgi:mannan endo-1,4-beta-mannosidase
MPKAQELFKRHITQVTSRKNTVSGVHYQDDPAILAWELANEPQSDSRLIAWATETAQHIKDSAPKQLITTGSEAKFGSKDFKELHSLPNIDFACAHVSSFALLGYGRRN